MAQLERIASCRAVLSTGGKERPRLSARRIIPSHAVGLKKYSCGASRHRMSDKKHTAAPLGYSEELSVQHSPRESIPAVFQLPEEGAKGSPFVL